MYRNRSNRIFPIIIILVVLIALVAGLVTVGRYIFSSNTGEKSQEETKQDIERKSLTTVDANRSVRMTVRGPIVANQEFRSYRISVSPSQNSYTVYKGYLDSVDSNKSYDNNTQAYEQFVYALDKADMTKPGKSSERQSSDLRGVCATGKIFLYEIVDGANVVHSYWTSTCKGSPGTFGASVNQVTNLFVNQIPDLDNTFTQQQLIF